MSQVGPSSLTLTKAESDDVSARLSSCVKHDGSVNSVISVYKQMDCTNSQLISALVWHTELSEVEACAGGRGEAGAGGERGVTSRVLQPAGGVGT